MNTKKQCVMLLDANAWFDSDSGGPIPLKKVQEMVSGNCDPASFHQYVWDEHFSIIRYVTYEDVVNGIVDSNALTSCSSLA